MCLSHYWGGRCIYVCVCVDNGSSNNSRTEIKNFFLITIEKKKEHVQEKNKCFIFCKEYIY
jgi:hypothetical protein